MQARKESLWRNLLGVAYALTVTFTSGEGQLTIGLGGHEWVDAAVSGAIGLVAVPPVLLGTAYGIWKENQLDKEVWQVIDERVSRQQEGGPARQCHRPVPGVLGYAHASATGLVHRTNAGSAARRGRAQRTAIARGIVPSGHEGSVYLCRPA